MTDLEYFIEIINNYRDELADRRGRIEKHKYIGLTDRGYINAMDDIISDLFYLTEKLKVKQKNDYKGSKV